MINLTNDIDILSVPELADTHFALMDISERNIDMVCQLCERDVKANNLPAHVEATVDRRAAIADYVISTIRQGRLEAFQLDIDIPLKYGVDQCVGDTICAGGIMYAQRTIIELIDFCKDIREVAKRVNIKVRLDCTPAASKKWPKMRPRRVLTPMPQTRAI